MRRSSSPRATTSSGPRSCSRRPTPARYGGKPGFRFRVARRFGYGVSAEMARRCLERLDEEGIHGVARVLWALSDTRPVQTQGPVWHSGGRSV